MTYEDHVVNVFKREKPKNIKDIRSLGFKVRKCGEGAFRTVYHFAGLPLIVKIPKPDNSWNDYSQNVRHSKDEITAYRAVTKRHALRALRPFMPVFHYMDYKNGIIISDKYDEITSTKAQDVVTNIFGKLIEELTQSDPEWDIDLHSANIAKDKLGDYKFIDLGMLINGL